MRGAIAAIVIAAVVVIGYCVTNVCTTGVINMNAKASRMSAFSTVVAHISSSSYILT